MHKEYVKKIDDVYRVGDTRVSFDSLVYLFREGMSVESMVESYPALTLEEVHGALAYFLANQEAIDAYLPKRCPRNSQSNRPAKTEPVVSKNSIRTGINGY